MKIFFIPSILLLLVAIISCQDDDGEEVTVIDAGATPIDKLIETTRIELSQPVPVAAHSCRYEFTLPANAFRDSCHTTEVERIVQALRNEYHAILADNNKLRDELASIRGDYQNMVNTVKTMESDTATWREVFEWPRITPPFRPENASLIIATEHAYSDCVAAVQAKSKAGIYNLKPRDSIVPFLAFCDKDGWTVIQRRFNGEVDFYRGWDDYSRGFGQLSGEFWLGLENMHQLTKDTFYELRAEVLGWNDKMYQANHDHFAVGSEVEEYKLHISNQTSGNYQDVLSPLYGLGFSTSDRDNDQWYYANCAEYYRGGFWLDQCGSDINREWCGGGGCMSWGDKIVKKSLLKIKPMTGGRRSRSVRKPSSAAEERAATVELIDLEDGDSWTGKRRRRHTQP